MYDCIKLDRIHLLLLVYVFLYIGGSYTVCLIIGRSFILVQS